MSPSQVEEMFAIAWFMLAAQVSENMLKIVCVSFGLWSIIFAILHAVRDFTAV